MRRALIERWNAFTVEQKISVSILGVCGGLALALSFYHLSASIREPFLSDKSAALAFKSSLAPTDDEIEAQQRRTDTDGDGLSDWDEVNVYHTNPNLKDSCGDGTPDNVRVATGKNLNCAEKMGNPSGEIDTSGIEATSSQLLGNQLSGTVDANTIISDFSDAAARSGLGASANASATTTEGPAIPRDPKAIRAALVGKVDQAKLSSISDEQLLQYYDTALAQQQADQSAASQTPSTVSP